MPEFLSKYSNIKGWIPSTDVDEVDAPKDYARDISNIDYENGFIVPAVEPINVALPTVVRSWILAGWELLGYKYFYHSTQGDTYVSILYNYYDIEHHLKFYVNSEEVILDEVSEDFNFSTKPTIISYGLAKDQLKISLNIVGSYEFKGEYPPLYPIMNLTVMYLSDRSYVDSTIYLRSAGWFIYPRWLSWTLENSLVEITYGTPAYSVEVSGTTLYEVEDEDPADFRSYDHFFTQMDLVEHTQYTIAKYEFLNGSGSEFYRRASFLKGVKFGKTLKFTYQFYNMNISYGRVIVGITNDTYGSDELTGSSNNYYPENQDSWVELYNEVFPGEDNDGIIHTYEEDVDIILGKYDNIDSGSFHVWIIGEVSPKSGASDPEFNIWDISLSGIGACILSYHEDKQRALIKGETEEVDEPTVLLSIFNDPWIKFPICRTDWRVTKYELYIYTQGVYILYALAEVDGEWAEYSLEFFFRIFTRKDNYPGTIDTLAFNYGLGASVRVDNQKNIYREAVYRNRTYFTKDDEKIYFSHLAGSGLIQADSFPYNEDTQYGFIISNSQEINKAIAVTALDELIVIGERRCYVYTIEGTGAIPYRRIKAINGGAGITEINSLITELDGTPATKMLIWVNEQGVFGYAGGREVPVSLTGITHRNYWLSLDKTDAVAIYNNLKDEYWLQMEDHILIYEILTGSWKKYNLSSNIKDSVGVIDGYSHYLTEDNKVYKISEIGDKLSSYIEFHDIVDGDGEIQAKSLHDVYMTLKTPNATGSTIKTEIIIDGITLEDEELYFLVTQLRSKSVAPYQVQYGRIRFKLTLPQLNIAIRELGYVYSKLPIYNTDVMALTGVGQKVGSELGKYF